MPEVTSNDIENIKKALVQAGILTTTTPTAEEEAKLQAALARHGVDTNVSANKLICNKAHYCIVVKS